MPPLTTPERTREYPLRTLQAMVGFDWGLDALLAQEQFVSFLEDTRWAPCCNVLRLIATFRASWQRFAPPGGRRRRHYEYPEYPPLARRVPHVSTHAHCSGESSKAGKEAKHAIAASLVAAPDSRRRRAPPSPRPRDRPCE